MNKKPVPLPTDTSRPFWQALREHRIMIQHCADCATWIFYPRSNCPHCLSDQLNWTEIGGQGEVYSFTIARVPTLPEFADEAPQILAVVQLPEGPRVNTTLVDINPELARIGMKVKPVFDDAADITLLRYTSAG